MELNLIQSQSAFYKEDTNDGSALLEITNAAVDLTQYCPR